MKKRLARLTALMIVAVMALTACAPANTGAPADNTPPAGADASHDGTYTASFPGFAGDINATLTVKDGVVDTFVVEGAGETVGIGDVVIDAYNETLAATVGKSPADIAGLTVDVVSGATVTSEAAADAIAKVIDDASGDT